MLSVRENLVRALRGEDFEQFPFAVYPALFSVADFQEDEDISNVAKLAAATPWRTEYESVTVETEPLPDGGEVTVYRTPWAI